MQKSRSALLALLPLLALAACGQAEKDAGKIENTADRIEATDANAVDAMAATDKAQFQSTDATIDNGVVAADADAKADAAKVAGDVSKDAHKIGHDLDKMGATDKAQFKATDHAIDKDAKKVVKAVEKDVR